MSTAISNSDDDETDEALTTCADLIWFLDQIEIGLAMARGNANKFHRRAADFVLAGNASTTAPVHTHDRNVFEMLEALGHWQQRWRDVLAAARDKITTTDSWNSTGDAP